MSQGPLTPTKILFLDHTLLKRMNFFLIISLTIMVCVFALRINFSITYMKNYTEIMNADSSVSDLMQLCEVTYDYAILMRESIEGERGVDGEEIDTGYLSRVVMDILEMLEGLTQRDGLAQGRTTTKSVLESVSYL